MRRMDINIYNVITPWKFYIEFSLVHVIYNYNKDNTDTMMYDYKIHSYLMGRNLLQTYW